MKNRDGLAEAFRWFGPLDPVPLEFIRQAGASEVFTSLHQIPYGEPWPVEAIRERRMMIEAAGLRWTVAESVPVHEDIKVGKGNLAQLFENYRQSLHHLAAEGINIVVYNFMPVLDWVRTDTRHVLPDGSESMFFNPVHFAAFELYALKRAGAAADYTAEQRERAKRWWTQLEINAQTAFIQTIIDVFPGVKWGLSLDDIRCMLARYDGIDSQALRDHLARFLDAVVPAAADAGVRLAIHPDDPPFPVLGLPRIVSTASDLRTILRMTEDPAHGLCFCTGSLSARADNDLPAMVAEFGERFHAVHLRSTQRLADGSFFEADHLQGSMDMVQVVALLIEEQDRRRACGREDWRLVFRPDHGHTMMDDLAKPPGITPGYSCIGRMRGLSELRGVMAGLNYGK